MRPGIIFVDLAPMLVNTNPARNFSIARIRCRIAKLDRSKISDRPRHGVAINNGPPGHRIKTLNRRKIDIDIPLEVDRFYPCEIDPEDKITPLFAFEAATKLIGGRILKIGRDTRQVRVLKYAESRRRARTGSLYSVADRLQLRRSQAGERVE